MIKEIIKLVLSDKVLNKLITWKDIYLDKHFIESYSQEGEDIILRKLFNNKLTGFYVDVGAHHPKRFSNTYFFYKKGWSGINIDAMPNSMSLFNKIRPNDINIEIPISDKKEILTYYAFNEPALNGFSKELSEDRINQDNNYHLIFTKEMETSKLEEILDSNLLRKNIDFLSIDVEGLDFMVLKSTNLEKYRPKVILIEILGNNIENILDHDIAKYLKKYNYVLYAKTVSTAIFIENS